MRCPVCAFVFPELVRHRESSDPYEFGFGLVLLLGMAYTSQVFCVELAPVYVYKSM